jgi:hypothetical protein
LSLIRLGKALPPWPARRLYFGTARGGTDGKSEPDAPLRFALSLSPLARGSVDARDLQHGGSRRRGLHQNPVRVDRVELVVAEALPEAVGDLTAGSANEDLRRARVPLVEVRDRMDVEIGCAFEDAYALHADRPARDGLGNIERPLDAGDPRVRM